MENKTTTTCQICGRSIKSSKGVIAHHGYRRPAHEGWQSASCFGARYRPYEIACDALPKAIDQINEFIRIHEKRLNDFLANPPETLEVKQSYPRQGMTTIQRPADFQYGKNSIRPWSYESAYESKKYSLEMSIKGAKKDLIYMTNRLSNWKAI
jgi:hypothetical protein